MNSRLSTFSLGRLRQAPEGFLETSVVEQLTAQGLDAQRRDFIRNSFWGALAAATSAKALAQPVIGDPAILDKQTWATTLGKPVASQPYGLPSKYEASLVRRESPGLTRVSAASVAFTPLQGLFGMITPSGLHFERHHQGWYDIDPALHRLMIDGMV